jgi:hypothetical protein
MRFWHSIAIGLLVSVPLPALAQINPFVSSRAAPRLSDQDMKLLLASVDQLNAQPDVSVGASNSWNNPETGSHGSSSVTRIFKSHGMTCHRLHHEVAAGGRTPPRTYDLNWCLTPDGSWKTKG